MTLGPRASTESKEELKGKKWCVFYVCACVSVCVYMCVHGMSVCREPPTHLRLLPVRHFVGIARFLSILRCTFSVTKIGNVGSSCTRSELVRDDG